MNREVAAQPPECLAHVCVRRLLLVSETDAEQDAGVSKLSLLNCIAKCGLVDVNSPEGKKFGLGQRVTSCHL